MREGGLGRLGGLRTICREGGLERVDGLMRVGVSYLIVIFFAVPKKFGGWGPKICLWGCPFLFCRSKIFCEGVHNFLVVLGGPGTAAGGAR